MDQANKYGTLEIQTELLSLLKSFHGFCVENNISYGLSYGSLLGAVRHQGFIPWDDDLDICIEREEYNKLIDKINQSKDLLLRRKIWVDRIQKKNTVKIQGVLPTIDVFIIDNAPDNPILLDLKIFFLSVLQGMMKEKVSYSDYSPVYRLFLYATHIMGKLFSDHTLWKWYCSVSQMGNGRQTKKVHCSNTSFRELKKMYDGNAWHDLKLTEFEGERFFIPANYDPILTTDYGDYMTPPEEKDRITTHANMFD